MPLLDNEDRRSSSPGNSSEEDGSDDEIQKGPKKKARKIYTGTGRFQCMENKNGSPDGKNPNARTIQVVRPVSIAPDFNVLTFPYLVDRDGGILHPIGG